MAVFLTVKFSMFHFNIKKVSGNKTVEKRIAGIILVCAAALTGWFIAKSALPAQVNQTILPAAQQTEHVTAQVSAQFCSWQTTVSQPAYVRTGELVQRADGLSVDTQSTQTELANDDFTEEDVQAETEEGSLEAEEEAILESSDFVPAEKFTEEEILTAASEQMDAPETNIENVSYMEVGTSYSGYSEAALNGTFTKEEAALMKDLGCTPDKEGEKLLLAKAISCEAGPNKLDQLMVGAVIINRMKSSEFAYADTIIEVLSAPRQYAVYPDCIRNSKPSEEILSTAEQLLEGRFSIPSNVIFQAAFTQGTSGGTYLFVNNKNQHPGFYNSYYCYNHGLSTVDCFGRPALTADQVIALAEALHEEDVAKGIDTSPATP